MRGGERGDEPALDRRSVLELVHEYVLILRRHGPRRRRRLLEELHRPNEQVLKVETVALRLSLDVAAREALDARALVWAHVMRLDKAPPRRRAWHRRHCRRREGSWKALTFV